MLQLVAIAPPLLLDFASVPLAIPHQNVFHMMDAVTPRNPAPHVHVFARPEPRIEAASLVKYSLANYGHRRRGPPMEKADGLDARQSIGEPRTVDDFPAVRVELDVIAGHHVSAGAPRFSNLPFQLRWHP